MFNPNEKITNVYIGFENPKTRERRWVKKDELGVISTCEEQTEAHLYPGLTEKDLHAFMAYLTAHFEGWDLQIIKAKVVH